MSNTTMLVVVLVVLYSNIYIYIYYIGADIKHLSLEGINILIPNTK